MKNELKTDLEKIAYNCRRATFLIERKQEIELTDREQYELKIHLAGCYICRIYEEQSLLINDMVRHLFDPEKRSGVTLDDDYKRMLAQKIREKQNKS